MVDGVELLAGDVVAGMTEALHLTVSVHREGPIDRRLRAAVDGGGGIVAPPQPQSWHDQAAGGGVALGLFDPREPSRYAR